MFNTIINNAIRLLKNEQLIIIIDDLVKNTSFLMGLAENVSPQNVNLMTKVGKGLTYVCISESKAKQLNLPLMVKDQSNFQGQDFTVSVDYKSTTTGISAFERAETIKAMTKTNIKPDDFHKPGHIFPLISKEHGLLQRIDVVEASIDLAKYCTEIPFSYLTEILNDYGEIATLSEVEMISKVYDFNVVKLSDILKTKNNQVIHSFAAKVINGKQIGRKIGFPTANLDISEHEVQLDQGVYGVKVFYKNFEYFGIMNIGTNLTFNSKESSLHYEVHIIHFNKDIYGDILKIDVCFYIREEISFRNVDQLVLQIHKDKKVALDRFNLTRIGLVNHGG